MTKLEDELQDLNIMMGESLREQMGLDNSWEYSDLPWMKQEYYDKLMATIGEDNYKFVSGSTMSGSHEVRIRASVFINPTGLRNIRKYAEQVQT